MTILGLLVALIQLYFTVFETKSTKYYFIGRMMYPIMQAVFLVICLLVSTKTVKVIDNDISDKAAQSDQPLCFQAQILLFKIQNVVQ